MKKQSLIIVDISKNLMNQKIRLNGLYLLIGIQPKKNINMMNIDYLIKIVGEDMVEEEIMVEEVADTVADAAE